VRQFKELLNSPYREKALLEIPLSYYLAQDYPKALAEIEKLRSPSFSLISKARSLYLKGRCLLKLRKYSEAKAAFANLLKLPENNFTSLAQELKNKAEAALNLPRKKPLLALFLSAIIPGSGKFYLGRKYDGAFSFLLTTSSALITYYYYHQRKTFQTFLAGSLTIFFYTGNIYGSWIGARLFNKKLDQRYLEELERTYPVSIFE
jgi:tetratricopeptide (TPR) repeat protein